MSQKNTLDMTYNSLEYRKKRMTMININSFLLSILPILLAYKTIIPGVNLAELVMIIMFFYSFTYKSIKNNNQKINKSIKKYWIFYFIFIYVSSLLALLAIQENIINVVVRTIRYSFYILFSIVCINKMIDIKKVLRYSIMVSIIITVVLIIQYIIFYTTGIVVKGYISSLIYTERLGPAIITDTTIIRGTGLFTEPSYVGQYMFGPLCYCLLSNNKNNKNKLYAIIITLGMLLSKSLWTYVFAGIIWIVWLLKGILSRKIKLRYFLLLILTPVIISLLSQTNLVQEALQRVDLDNITSSQSYIARFGGSENLKNLNLYQRIFGIGFGNLRNYDVTNYFLYIQFGMGIVGASIFILISFLTIIKIKTLWQKTIFFCLFILCFGENILLFVSCAYIFILCFSTYKEDKN